MQHLHTVSSESSTLSITTKFGSLAQLVERLPYTQNVGSSRLSRPTIRPLTQLDRVLVFETGSWEFESLRAGHATLADVVIAVV